MRAGTRKLTVTGLLAAAVLSLGLSACSDSGSSSKAKATSTTATTEAATTTTAAATTTTAGATTTTAGQSGSGVAAGTYVNGSSNTPHYSLVMQTSNGNGIGGTMSYVFQDGTSQQSFTFSGTASNGSGNATPSTGSAFSFTYTPTQVVIANCSALLTQQPNTCTFTKQ